MLLCMLAVAVMTVGRSLVPGLAAAALAATAAGDTTSAGVTPETAPSLELVTTFEVQSLGGESPLDIRWASEESVLLLFVRQGVSEHALEEGVPRRRSRIPRNAHPERVRGLTTLAFSSGTTVAASQSSQLVLHREGPVAGALDVELRDPPGGNGKIADLDLDGDELVLYGVPSRPERGEAVPSLWRASLDRGLRELALEPLSDWEERLGRAPGDRPKWEALRTHAASLRLSSRGEILLYTGSGGRLYLLEEHGKEVSSWSLAELLPGEDPVRSVSERLEAQGETSSLASVRSAWRADGVTNVDDVLFVGRRPAAVIRRVREGRAEWSLAMLRPEGAEVYQVPTPSSRTGARLRADFSKATGIVFLLSDRYPGPEAPKAWICQAKSP